MTDNSLYHASDHFWYAYDEVSGVLSRFVHGSHEPPVPCYPLGWQCGLWLGSRPLFGQCGHGPSTAELAITENMCWLVDLVKLSLTRLPVFGNVINEESLVAMAVNTNFKTALAKTSASGLIYAVNLHSGTTTRIEVSNDTGRLKMGFADVRGGLAVISTGNNLNVCCIKHPSERKIRSVQGGVQDFEVCLFWRHIHVLTSNPCESNGGQKVITYSCNLSALRCVELAAPSPTKIFYSSISPLANLDGTECPPCVVRAVGDFKEAKILEPVRGGLYKLGIDKCKDLANVYDQLWTFRGKWVGRATNASRLSLLTEREVNV